MHKVYIILVFLLVSCSARKINSARTNYTNFKIYSIKLISMPSSKPNSSNWDFFNGPDVFYCIESEMGSVLNCGEHYNDIRMSHLPLNWTFVNAFPVTNINAKWRVVIYDSDTPDKDDHIGFVSFTMAEHKSGYPKTITKTNNGVTITIEGEWY